ncbi:MAG: hypothetical protein ACKOC5_05375 [Chloroflexota bacterium]
MLLSPGEMRTLLLVCMLGMLIIAGLFLRRRGLSPAQTLGWGALLMLPLSGPFLVLLIRPGSKRTLHAPR